MNRVIFCVVILLNFILHAQEEVPSAEQPVTRPEAPTQPQNQSQIDRLKKTISQHLDDLQKQIHECSEENDHQSMLIQQLIQHINNLDHLIDLQTNDLCAVKQENQIAISRLEECNFLHENQTVLNENQAALNEKINFLEAELQQALNQIDNQNNYNRERVGEAIYDLKNQVNYVAHQIPPCPPPPVYLNTRTCRAGAEFLAWTIFESELDFVVSDAPTALSPLNTSGVIGKLNNAEFDWRPGFKVYLDCSSCRNDWHLFGQYTYFYCSGQNRVTPAPNTLLQATFHEIVSGNSIREATSHIHFHYNLADLLFKHDFYLTPRFNAHLVMGGVGAWIKQNWFIHYFPTLGITPSVINENVDVIWEFQGGGLKGGIGCNWFMTPCLCLQAEAQAAVLVGSYQNFLKVVSFGESGPGVGFFFESINSRNCMWRCTQTLQLRLGPNWLVRWAGLDARMYLLYELNTWIGLQEIDRSFVGLATEGRDSHHVEGFLGIHGVTLGIECAF